MLFPDCWLNRRNFAILTFTKVICLTKMSKNCTWCNDFSKWNTLCVCARAPMNEYACWNRWNNNRHIQYRHRFILNVLLTRLAFPSISSSYVGDSVVSVRATKHRESCYRREENRRFIIYWTQINENWRLNIVMPFFSDLWL